MKDRGNLKGTSRTLDGTNGFSILEKGLMSTNGFTVLDDSKTLVFNEDYWLEPRMEKKKRNIDMYFFGHGSDYLGCLVDYYKVSGKTPMIPRYILGNWWSRYWEYDEKELKELINNFKLHDIPLSVCIIDMDWHLVKIDKKYGRGWTGYTWNLDLFPDPEGMLRWLHEKNLKVALNLHPADGFKGHEECYERVADFMGVNKEIEEPVDFDIANPKFVAAYFDLVHHPLEEQGVDFWWLDWQQGSRTKMKNLDPLWMLNHLHYLDLGRDKKTRSFIFSRWGGKGNHRYPIGFSGDTFTTWRSLNYQPYFTAIASNVGYGWWSHDIGGHMFGTETGELYTRWVQWGIFSPIFRLHTSKNPYSKREPWNFDKNTLFYAREAMRLRHRMVPYIYSMAYQNFENDVPLMRPLYYYGPLNKQKYKNKNTYWFGSEFLVHPITTKRHMITDRVLHTTYLPPENQIYFNYFTKESYEGGKTITRPYGLGDIPVFVKAGSIIPLDGGQLENGIKNPEVLTIEIFPGNSNSFSLYEDDGVSESYKENKHYISEIKWTWGQDASLEITLPETVPDYIPKNRKINLVFYQIKYEGKPNVSSNSNVQTVTSYSEEEHVLKVEIPSISFKTLKVDLKSVEVIKKDLLKEQANRMLFDSNKSLLFKNYVFGRKLRKEPFTEKDLKSLWRKLILF
jgi:alpha-glucosidase (family GH31 glycosyl hydrolase)